MALRPAPYDPAKNEYPKMVYPPGSAPKRGKGKVVQNKAEEDAYFAAFAPKEEAKSEGKDEPETALSEALSGAAEKQALYDEAIKLGIDADKRWGAAKLREAIDAKKAG